MVILEKLHQTSLYLVKLRLNVLARTEEGSVATGQQKPPAPRLAGGGQHRLYAACAVGVAEEPRVDVVALTQRERRPQVLKGPAL